MRARIYLKGEVPYILVYKALPCVRRTLKIKEILGYETWKEMISNF
jgi:hypothetical protein